MKSEESMALDVIRMIMLASQQPKCVSVSVRVHDTVSSFLNNQKRRDLSNLEGDGKLKIKILGSESVFPEHLELDCRDEKGNEVRLPLNPKSR